MGAVSIVLNLTRAHKNPQYFIQYWGGCMAPFACQQFTLALWVISQPFIFILELYVHMARTLKNLKFSVYKTTNCFASNFFLRCQKWDYRLEKKINEGLLYLQAIVAKVRSFFSLILWTSIPSWWQINRSYRMHT